MVDDDEKPVPGVAPISDIPERIYLSMAAIAGMELDVFSQFAHGPRDAPTVAKTLQIDAGRLSRLLYALVNAKLLEVEGAEFRNTAAADYYLVKGKPTYLGGAYELWRDFSEATMCSAESIRNGKAVAKHDFESMSDEDKGAFFRGLHGGAKSAGRALAKTCNFARFSSLIDVGGGSGGVAVGACEVVPNLSATVADFPEIVGLAEEFVVSDGLGERIDVVGVDISSDIPSGEYDVAVLRYLIQTVSPDAAQAIIRNVHSCLKSGGEIYVLGWILEDSRLSPASAVLTDIVFLNVYDDGAAYTVSEHRSWLSDAGFIDFDWVPAPQGSTPGTILIQARKP